jgi:hypothetical protein
METLLEAPRTPIRTSPPVQEKALVLSYIPAPEENEAIHDAIASGLYTDMKDFLSRAICRELWHAATKD